MNDRPSRRGRPRTFRTFVVGSVVGGLVAVAAPRLRRGFEPKDRPQRMAGLEAFEGAPCWEHDRRRSGAAVDGDQ